MQCSIQSHLQFAQLALPRFLCDFIKLSSILRLISLNFGSARFLYQSPQISADEITPLKATAKASDEWQYICPYICPLDECLIKSF